MPVDGYISHLTAVPLLLTGIRTLLTAFTESIGIIKEHIPYIDEFGSNPCFEDFEPNFPKMRLQTAASLPRSLQNDFLHFLKIPAA